MSITGKPHPAVAGLGVGVLMLDTHFARVAGDIGNARTWSIPVQFKIVKGASPKRVVEEADPGLLQPFIDAALELVELGVGGITTSCGFLAMFQKELQDALPVPVASSSLMQVPLVRATLPRGKRVGILTFSAENLSSQHLSAAGIDFEVAIQGVKPGGAFHSVYGNSGSQASFATLESDVIESASVLLDRCPDIGAIVCECTNMPPIRQP